MSNLEMKYFCRAIGYNFFIHGSFFNSLVYFTIFLHIIRWRPWNFLFWQTYIICQSGFISAQLLLYESFSHCFYCSSWNDTTECHLWLIKWQGTNDMALFSWMLTFIQRSQLNPAKLLHVDGWNIMKWRDSSHNPATAHSCIIPLFILSSLEESHYIYLFCVVIQFHPNV